MSKLKLHRKDDALVSNPLSNLSNWDCCRLDQLGSKDHPVLKAGPFGSSVTKDIYVGEGYKVYGQQEVVSKNVDAEKYYVTKEVFRAHESCAVEPGDILITMMGTIGRVFEVPERSEPGIINPRLMRISVDRSRALPAFVTLVLESSGVQRLLERRSHGGTMQGLNTQAIASLQIPLPPFDQQRKIVEILRTWDEAIEKLKALRSAKERRFAAAAQRLLAPSRAIGRHILRSNWSPTTFGEVFEERQDRNARLGPDDVVTVGKYAIRKQSEHFNRSVASKDQSNYWTISPGDFVYDPMSAYYGAIGRYEGVQDGIVSPAYRVIRLLPGVDSDFMVDLLRSHHIRFLLETRSSQGNKEGKRRLLQRDEFSEIEFNLPPIKVQRDISLKLALFRQDVAAAERKIEALSRQKRGLMQKLLTGEWPVKVDGKKESAA